MRSKTVKRLAILIAVLGLIGGTGFFVHGSNQAAGSVRGGAKLTAPRRKATLPRPRCF